MYKFTWKYTLLFAQFGCDVGGAGASAGGDGGDYSIVSLSLSVSVCLPLHVYVLVIVLQCLLLTIGFLMIAGFFLSSSFLHQNILTVIVVIPTPYNPQSTITEIYFKLRILFVLLLSTVSPARFNPIHNNSNYNRKRKWKLEKFRRMAKNWEQKGKNRPTD